MRLETEFIQLPLHFDASRLLNEVSLIDESYWQPHPQNFKGNSALILVSVDGDYKDQSLSGPMLPTEILDRLPYLKQVLASFKSPIGRTRLMRLDGESEASQHMDSNYYWQDRVRIHIPIKTHPEVVFHCSDKKLHMAAGESWIFDTWKMHRVENPVNKQRIHLVIDTVGSSYFWDMVKQSSDSRSPTMLNTPFIDNTDGVEIDYEKVNTPTMIMTPWELNQRLNDLLAETLPAIDKPIIESLFHRLKKDWRALWAIYGDNPEGSTHYSALLDRINHQITALINALPLANGMELTPMFNQLINQVAIGESQEGQSDTDKASNPSIEKIHHFDRPIFIIAAPRSGSSLLFETLANSPELYTLGGESHKQFESIPALNPKNQGWHSNRLTENDVTCDIETTLKNNFISGLHNYNGTHLSGCSNTYNSIRMLEKTPKNALRIHFIKKIFPDAKFIYLIREAKENISSIMEAWKSNKFITYPSLPEWEGQPPWSLLLTPGWREHKNTNFQTIAANQWADTHRIILNDLATLNLADWMPVSYADLINDKQSVIESICQFAEVDWDSQWNWDKALPLSAHTLTPPAKDKWKKNADELTNVKTLYEPIEQALTDLKHSPHLIGHINQSLKRSLNEQQLNHLFSPNHVPLLTPPKPVDSDQQQHKPPKPDESGPIKATELTAKNDDFSSTHTNTFAQLLKENNCSLLVTTYQAGKLVLIREDQGIINTRFQEYHRPMGVALSNDTIAIGTHHHIKTLRNQPDVSKKLDSEKNYDACFIPKSSHVTGNIDIHEMDYDDKGNLWFINTGFSCLCSFNSDYSFVPEWHPPFISSYAAEDRCHLNGLAMRNGLPRYVSALGVSDKGNGWRDTKANGGVIIDLKTDGIIIKGLSMPHSPRWYGNNLWLLESGKGSLNMWQQKKKRLLTVCSLPGFTRGLDFINDVAFVGLSQVRESGLFSGLEITEKFTSDERFCGVWAINMRTGDILGYLKFEGSVQEIFSVKVLKNKPYPEILSENDPLLGHSYVIPTQHFNAFNNN